MLKALAAVELKYIYIYIYLFYSTPDYIIQLTLFFSFLSFFLTVLFLIITPKLSSLKLSLVLSSSSHHFTAASAYAVDVPAHAVAGLWQIDGGFCHGLVVSWWLGWLEWWWWWWWWWCREGLWVEEREERVKTEIKMNSEKNNNK